MSKLKARILWTAVLAVCVSVLVISARLNPHPAGYGTHRQLTGAPCLFRFILNVPCATCGMTTSFAHMARLQVRRALAAQPVGALLYVGTILLAVMAIAKIITGNTGRLRLPPDWVLALAVVCLFAGWIYKIVH